MKPILTRAEVIQVSNLTDEFGAKYGEQLWAKSTIHITKASLNTITEAVELLRDVDKAFCTHEADEWYQEHYFTVVESIEAFLARYEGKEPTQENAK